MNKGEKTVARFNNGRTLKGHVRGFFPSDEKITIVEATDSRETSINVSDLKAIFFVKSFEGDRQYKEKKKYGATKATGQRVFVKFKDGEILIGFLEGDIPWDKGFFMSKQNPEIRGFFLFPVDEGSNNKKVFVVASSVVDVTVVPLASGAKAEVV